MKTKHTPSPWIFDEANMKIKGSGDVEGLTVIANVSPKMDYSRGYNTQCSNAKLIAAAPDLLEVCINSFKTFHSIGCTMEAEIMQQLEAAIKKATE